MTGSLLNQLKAALLTQCKVFVAMPDTSLSRLPSRRTINFFGFAACVAMLSFGYFLQYVQGLEPCPMCILQRIAILFTGCVFLVAALHNPRHWGAKVYGLLLALTIGIGAALSIRHIWLQYFISEDSALACGMSYDYMMEVFSPFEALTMILRGTGDCAEIVWTFLGLSIPSWTLICFLILGIIGVTRNWMRAEPLLHSAVTARS